jgi:D-alanyl-D-alanine carboxypeptidase (penicillin-binding protein 5/6)
MSIPGLFFGDDTAAVQPTQNTSTAYDLALLSRYAYGKSIVRRTVVKKEMEVDSTDGKIKHQLKNTNELLGGYLKILGLKTGTTDEAGECLITIIEDDKGDDVLTVVLNSPERYTETKLLADWVFRAYKWN